MQCGEFTVSAEGRYGLMPCYRDDPTTPGVDEGAEPGDSITFRINAVSAVSQVRSLNGAAVDPNTLVVWSGNLDRWEVDLYVPPLAVDLAFFTAQVEGATVHLAWETVSEVDHQGFNGYRGPAPNGPWTRLNDVLIASPAPGSTAGQHYEWLDTAALAGQVTWYQLEAMDVAGAARMAGLTSVRPDQPSLSRKTWLPLILRQPAAD